MIVRMRMATMMEVKKLNGILIQSNQKVEKVLILQPKQQKRAMDLPVLLQ